MKKKLSVGAHYLANAKEYAERILSGELLEHTRGCVETARKLALRLNVNASKAEAASYLHDIAKIHSHDKQAALARTLGMTDGEINSYPRAVLHGPLAAVIAEQQLGIEDAEILQAIRAHSTGCAGMTEVAKVVFVADYIELTRSFPGADELRAHGHNQHVTLDDLTAAILRRKIEYLLDFRKVIDPRAIALWNELIIEHY
jgi:predicted HD superfamily hydrolase involved in NAD metabolism